MPISYRNLWPQLASFENLWLAYLAARRGKRARPAVAAYELTADTRLLRLQERLEDGSYTPGAYRHPWAGNGGAHREHPTRRQPSNIAEGAHL